MNLHNLITALLCHLNVIPILAACLAPIKNRMKYPLWRTLLIFAVALLVLMPITIYLETRFQLEHLVLDLFLLTTLFIIYHLILDIHISKSLSVFILVTTFMSFMSGAATYYDAMQFPDSELKYFSVRGAVFLLISCTILCALLFYPLLRYGSYLINNLNDNRIWYITFSVSGIVLVYNLSITVHRYNSLHINNVSKGYVSSLTLMFLLMTLLCILYYFIVNSMLEKSEIESTNRIFEMQELQYQSQQRYMETSARARHDFKHTIHTLKILADNGDLAEIQNYLKTYTDTLPKNECIRYCSNNALNALLNFYAQSAAVNSIPIEYKIALSDELYIKTTDLCSIIGNILENAIYACDSIPEEDRYIQLSVTCRHDNEIYIVAVNSFDGNPKLKNDRYLSTHKNGKDIGLISITSTAKRYQGSANFYHKHTSFYSDVILINQEPLIQEAF